jgi:hypothetical protein
MNPNRGGASSREERESTPTCLGGSRVQKSRWISLITSDIRPGPNYQKPVKITTDSVKIADYQEESTDW